VVAQYGAAISSWGPGSSGTQTCAEARPEKLDPFKAYIVDRVKAAAPDRIPAIVLFREIKARGYDGGEGDLAQWHVVGARALGLELALWCSLPGKDHDRCGGALSMG
jgi:hypothetical protein